MSNVRSTSRPQLRRRYTMDLTDDERAEIKRIATFALIDALTDETAETMQRLIDTLDKPHRKGY